MWESHTKKFIYINVHIYIYIYMYICICSCIYLYLSEFEFSNLLEDSRSLASSLCLNTSSSTMMIRLSPILAIYLYSLLNSSIHVYEFEQLLIQPLGTSFYLLACTFTQIRLLHCFDLMLHTSLKAFKTRTPSSSIMI